jgi:hypothetical protein
MLKMDCYKRMENIIQHKFVAAVVDCDTPQVKRFLVEHKDFVPRLNLYHDGSLWDWNYTLHHHHFTSHYENLMNMHKHARQDFEVYISEFLDVLFSYEQLRDIMILGNRSLLNFLREWNCVPCFFKLFYPIGSIITTINSFSFDAIAPKLRSKHYWELFRFCIDHNYSWENRYSSSNNNVILFTSAWYLVDTGKVDPAYDNHYALENALEKCMMVPVYHLIRYTQIDPVSIKDSFARVVRNLLYKTRCYWCTNTLAPSCIPCTSAESDREKMLWLFITRRPKFAAVMRRHKRTPIVLKQLQIYDAIVLSHIALIRLGFPKEIRKLIANLNECQYEYHCPYSCYPEDFLKSYLI